MDGTELTYPVFEANQVLTSAQLNDLREYGDEQTRLTRANLIGIGVVCGLEVAFEAPGTVVVSKGCGVTSQGYLIVEPADLTFAHARPFSLALDDGYAPFVDAGAEPPRQFDLWELFPDDDQPGATPLAGGGLVLEEKAVVLFLELRKDSLRTCRPNDCDDGGNEVTATVRRLLVDTSDLDKVVAATGGWPGNARGVDRSERLRLPDLRMPRIDVPNGGPAEPEEVLRAFQEAFRRDKLVAATAAALTGLYDAFRPLVSDAFPDNPFAGFAKRFGFLDGIPSTTAQVRFLQYYWDLFDDLLAAYDETRWGGADLMCACAPPEGLFPRHLVLGRLAPPEGDADPYRQEFLPSPVIGRCRDDAGDVRALFARLVSISTSFTDNPPDKGIRATPSRWGDIPMSHKAIPYYYDHRGTPPIHELWDPVKTGRRRANQNLGYRADDYQPPAPAFVTDPLRYELEPHDFLRIEGHLGRNVQVVLGTLLKLRTSHRLPFEVVALRAGTFDEGFEVDLAREDCRFRDLEALYDVLTSELTCFLVKQTEYFYSLPAEHAVVEGTAAPSLGLLKAFAPGFSARPGTLGREIEGVLNWREGMEKPQVFELPGVPHLPSRVLALVGAMTDLAAGLSDDVRQLDFAVLAPAHRKVLGIAHGMDEARRGGFFDAPGLADRLDDILFRCRLDPFEALAEEYKRRVRDVRQAQFLGHFLERHPGIQHKAGVPLGGTFILVYHERPRQEKPSDPTGPIRPARPVGIIGEVAAPVAATAVRKTMDKAMGMALDRIRFDHRIAENPDVKMLYEAVTGRILVPRRPVPKAGGKVYIDAVAGLPDGSVIADFFLPYQCSSDCQPIHYQLPQPRLRVAVEMACTDARGNAEVTVAVEGASGPLSVQVDGGPFAEAAGPLPLAVGNHTIVVRDAAGAESAMETVAIAPPLVVGASEVVVDEAAGTFHVVATVEGGTPPYAADVGTLVDATYTSPLVPVAEDLDVTVTDAAGCATSATFESAVEPCGLPCDGVAEREGYRFWLPEARRGFPINGYSAEVRAFAVTDPDGHQTDLAGEVARIVNTPATIPATDFERVVARWLEAINTLVAGTVESDQWLRLEYGAAADSAATGTLFVDRLACLAFTFELTVAFTQGRRDHVIAFEYSPRGTVVVDRGQGSQAHIPPFGASTYNKCRPGEPPVPRCEGTDLELDFTREGAFPDAVVLRAVPSGGDAPAAFLWEVQDGIPAVSGDDVVKLGFEPDTPVEKLVRLTAFTEKGCSVTVERTIAIDGSED